MITFVSSSSQYLTSVSTFSPFIPGTVCFWVYPTLVTLSRYVFQADPSFLVRLSPGTATIAKISAILYRNSTTTTSNILTVNTLNHVAITWETSGSNTLINIYINAVLDISEAKTSNIPASGTLYIGQTGSSGNYLDAYLEDLRFYNRVLLLGEVESIYYSRGNDEIDYGLLNRWPMAEETYDGNTITGTGVIKDYINPGLHLTPAASPVYSSSFLKLRRKGNV